MGDAKPPLCRKRSDAIQLISTFWMIRWHLHTKFFLQSTCLRFRNAQFSQMHLRKRAVGNHVVPSRVV